MSRPSSSSQLASASEFEFAILELASASEVRFGKRVRVRVRNFVKEGSATAARKNLAAMSMTSEYVALGRRRGKGSVIVGTPSSSRRPDSSAHKKTFIRSPRLSPPPLTSASSASTPTPPERNSCYTSEESQGSSPEEDWCVGASSGEDNPLRLREWAKRSSPGNARQAACTRK